MVLNSGWYRDKLTPEIVEWAQGPKRLLRQTRRSDSARYRVDLKYRSSSRPSTYQPERKSVDARHVDLTAGTFQPLNPTSPLNPIAA